MEMKFAFIKTLELAEGTELNKSTNTFKEAMNMNYHLDDAIDAESILHDSEEDESKDYRDLVQWKIRKADDLYNLPVGTMFKGCTIEGLMYTYTIIGKDNNEPIWFPVSEEPELVAKLHQVDPETAQWSVIAIDDMESLTAWMMVNCKNAQFYKITDFEDKPFDVFSDGEADEENEDDGTISESRTIRMCYWPKDADEPNFISVETIQNFMDVVATYRDTVKRLEAIASR